MTDKITVFACDLAQGVGLPAIWWGHQEQGAEHYPGLDEPGWRQRPSGSSQEAWAGLDLYRVHLDEYQTRQGILRQLAMWAGDDGEGEAYWLDCDVEGVWFLERPGWESVAAFSHEPHRPDGTVAHHVPSLASVERDIDALKAIVTYIGQDHRIRRSLCQKPIPGTLATFKPHDFPGWLLIAPCKNSTPPERQQLYAAEPNPDPTVATNYTHILDLPLDDRAEAWSMIHCRARAQED
jgi:hypothetical protein